MIAFIAPHTSGNAIRVLLHPPMIADAWVVLRKISDTFTGSSDPDAILVYGGDERYFVDLTGLVNDETVFYRAYYFSGATLVSESATRSCSAASSFNFNSVDVISIVRDRLDLGLQSLVSRGILSHPQNLIPVMIASPLLEETMLPVVTVHCSSDSSETRAVGELLDTEEVYGINDCEEGYLSRYQLEIIGWSLNSDQRKLLHNAIKQLLLVNFPIFDACGFVTIDLQISDNEDFQTYQAPMFTANCAMRFLAPSSVSIPRDDLPIIDVQTIMSV